MECSRLEGEVGALHWRLRSAQLQADWEVRQGVINAWSASQLGLSNFWVSHVVFKKRIDKMMYLLKIYRQLPV